MLTFRLRHAEILMPPVDRFDADGITPRVIIAKMPPKASTALRVYIYAITLRLFTPLRRLRHYSRMPHCYVAACFIRHTCCYATYTLHMSCYHMLCPLPYCHHNNGDMNTALVAMPLPRMPAPPCRHAPCSRHHDNAYRTSLSLFFADFTRAPRR